MTKYTGNGFTCLVKYKVYKMTKYTGNGFTCLVKYKV